jgi:RNA polymerase sigma-70 factor, ECF subfamily
MPEPVPESSDDQRLDSTAFLLERVRAGDEPAREQLFARYLPVLRRWAHRRLPHGARDLHETDDLVQITLLRALANVGQFESRGEGAFFAYLRQILLNAIRDEIRRASRRQPPLEISTNLPGPGPNALEVALGHDMVRRYETGLAGLSPADRELVILRVEMRFEYAAIAEATGRKSADAARMAVGRALVRLAEEMDESR